MCVSVCVLRCTLFVACVWEWACESHYILCVVMLNEDCGGGLLYAYICVCVCELVSMSLWVIL